MDAIDSHVSDICLEVGTMRVDFKDWENALFQEMKRLLEHAKDKEQHARLQAVSYTHLTLPTILLV